MKSLYLAIVVVCSASGLLAQTNATDKYIEVTAEDTLLAQPDYYEYYVRVVSYTENEDVSAYRDAFQVEKQQQEAHQTHDKLLRIFKDKKIAYKKGQSDAFMKTPGPADILYEYTLTFTHVKQLADFYGEINDITQLEGYISLSKSSKNDVYEKAVTEKALEKARKKATILAGAAQVKLAGIIQIKEMVPENATFAGSVTPGWNIYPPLSSMSHSTITDLLQITYRKALTVRFAIAN